MVEFSARFQAGPIHRLRRIFEIMPEYSEINRRDSLNQANIQIATAESMTAKDVGSALGLTGDANQAQMKAFKAALRVQKEAASDGFDENLAYSKMLLKTIESGSADTIIGDTLDGKYICRVYRKFGREGRLDDIFNSHWHVLGKIIGFTYRDQEYDTLEGTALSSMPGDAKENLKNSFPKDKLNVDFDETKIPGPALIIATLGIFS